MPRSAWLLSLFLGALPSVGRAGTASNQLCAAAGQGAGCIGTPSAPSDPGTTAPQVSPAAGAAINNAVGGAIGGVLGGALATPTNYPTYQHKQVKPVVGGDDGIPADPGAGDAQDILNSYGAPATPSTPSAPSSSGVQPMTPIEPPPLIDAEVSCESGDDGGDDTDAEVDPESGFTSFDGEDMTLDFGSPALFGAPTFNSGSSASGPWGLGWSNDNDQFVSIESPRSVILVQANGQRLTFLNKTPEGEPTYVSPPAVEESLRAIAFDDAGIPTSIEERDRDGTRRLFTTAERPSVLRLSKLIDRNGNTVTYSRMGGLLTQVKDVHGRFLKLGYENGRVTTLTDSGGRTIRYLYDNKGRKTRETGPQGATSYEYDARNRLIRVIYPNKGIHAYSYDAKGRILAEDDGDGVNERDYVYSPRETSMTDALDRRTRYLMDAAGRVSRIVDSTGGATDLTYDENLNLRSETNPLGQSTTYSYDKSGNVVEKVNALGERTSVDYEPSLGLPSSITDFSGRTTRLQHDRAGNVTTVTDPLGNATRLEYDAAGHMVRSVDPLDKSIQFAYDPANGALASVTDALDHVTKYRTDALSRVTENTDALGRVTSYSYDPANDLVSAKDGLGNATSYEYVPGRRRKLLSAAIDADGHRISFHYDSQARLTDQVDPLGRTRTFVYDSASDPVQTTNFRGQNVSFGYDALGRLARKTTPEEVVSYSYDAASRVTGVLSDRGSALTLAYDAVGRVAKSVQTLPSGYSATLEYSYDANGNRTSMRTPWGTFSYLYDALNRVVSVTNPQKSTFVFSYDPGDRRTRKAAPNGVVTTYEYDGDGKISGLSTTNGKGVVVSSASYVYDAVGNVVSMTDIEGQHLYSYDGLYRLTAARHPEGGGRPIPQEVFRYDAAGNRLEDSSIAGYAYDAGNELTSNAEFAYAYDADGNLISKKNSHGNATAYEYDSENRLVGATAVSGRWTYSYDVLGRRSEKSSGPTPDRQSRYIYDGRNVLAELDGSNKTLRVFTNGRNIDEPLSMRDSTGADYTFSTDALGSVKVITNSDGNTVETYSYQAFGEPLIRDRAGDVASKSSVGNDFMFTAREYDAETKTYYLRGRYFDPASGRFLSVDPSGIAGGMNLYSYALNNPIVFSDPLGTDAIYISYAWYKVSIGSGYHLPLGHGGVVAVNPETGLTQYFEYGRYDAANYGIVRQEPVPNVVIGPNGLPTQDSLNNLYSFLSQNYGHGATVDPTYYADSSYSGTVGYATHTMHDPKRPHYSLLRNNCKQFGRRAATACKKNQSCPW